MTPSRAELSERYAKLSNARLVQMISRQHEYTAEAWEVLQEEVTRRNISRDEVQEFHDEQQQKIETIAINQQVSLQFWEKVVCFVGFFLPGFILHGLMLNYHEDFQARKVNQSRFYRIAGIISIVITVLASLFLTLTDTPAFLLLVALFILSIKLERRFVIQNGAQ